MTGPVGLVVEGISGAAAVRVLLTAAKVTIGTPLQFTGQPTDCSISTVVKCALLPRVQVMVIKGYRQVVVVLDREGRANCPGDLAERLLRELERQMAEQYDYHGVPPLAVVVSDRCLENWLIADPEGLLKHSYLDKSISNRVQHRADGKDAISMLNYAYRSGRYYHKSRDAASLAARVRVLDASVRRRSKSLDKLLRVVGVPAIG